MGWESDDKLRGEEENISPSRIMTSPFQELTFRLVIRYISVGGRYYDGSRMSGT